MSQLKDDVKYTVSIEEEIIPVAGNASASGDKNTDVVIEGKIYERLRKGDVWAWGTVTVTAHLDGFEGSVSLGCCNYRDEEEFRNDVYFSDMKREALQLLCISLEDAVKEGHLAKNILNKYGLSGIHVKESDLNGTRSQWNQKLS